jgi:hypothetical protein
VNPASDTEAVLPLGVSARTGQPLCELADEAVRDLLNRESEPSPELLAHQERSSPGETVFAVSGEFDAGDLSQVGWGVIFAAVADPAIKDALQPLIDHRRAQTEQGPFVIYEGPVGYRPGETALEWLGRQKVRLDVVNPDKGVPYYLLIVGSPEAIPFEFQYLLDLYWGVGRLWFDTPSEFRQYAESVVVYETAQRVPTSRQVALFATSHDFDAATQLFTRYVAKPLADGEGQRPVPIGERQKFRRRQFFGEDATKAALDLIYRGATTNGTPALVFSGSHGMEFDPDDPRQADAQGALVCADWGGFGSIKENAWFAAADVPTDANLLGMMHFLFACYGGGCPQLDNFDRLNRSPKKIAAVPFLSRLPRSLLTHPKGGSLACLAHVERAWAYSFQSDKGGSQSQGFRDVIGRLLRGERMGQATDSFNIRWAALSTELADVLNDLRFGADVPLKKLGQMWVARDDARNFLVLGDPAVRLRVEDMPELAENDSRSA